MIMRKWLISAVILTLALGTAGVVTAFALTSGGGSDSAEGTDTGGPALHGDPTYEEWLSNHALPEDESASTLVTTQDEGGGIEPGFEVEDSPEPLLVDGEHQYHQSLNDAIVEDCGLAGGTVYVTSDGEVGCVVAHDVEDSGKELVSSSQPPTVEPQPAPATK